MDQKRKWEEIKYKERKWREEFISLLLFGWKENEEKENEKVFFLLLGWEKSEKKENVIISNNYFTLNII